MMHQSTERASSSKESPVQRHALPERPRRDSRFELRTMMVFVAIVACLLAGLRAVGLSASEIAAGVIAVPLSCGMTIALIELLRGVPRQSG